MKVNVLRQTIQKKDKSVTSDNTFNDETQNSLYFQGLKMIGQVGRMHQIKVCNCGPFLLPFDIVIRNV